MDKKKYFLQLVNQEPQEVTEKEYRKMCSHISVNGRQLSEPKRFLVGHLMGWVEEITTEVPYTFYLHNTKDSNWYTWEHELKQDPEAEVAQNFSYCLLEIGLDVIVDLETGEIKQLRRLHVGKETYTLVLVENDK